MNTKTISLTFAISQAYALLVNRILYSKRIGKMTVSYKKIEGGTVLVIFPMRAGDVVVELSPPEAYMAEHGFTIYITPKYASINKGDLEDMCEAMKYIQSTLRSDLKYNTSVVANQ